MKNQLLNRLCALLFAPVIFSAIFISCKKSSHSPTTLSSVRTAYWTGMEGLDGGIVFRGTTKQDGTTKIDTLYSTADGVYVPFSVVVDGTRGLVYWINYKDGAEIKRATTDGSGSVSTVHTFGKGADWCTEMALDVKHNVLYVAYEFYDPADPVTIVKEEIASLDLNTPGAQLVTLYTVPGPERNIISDIKLDTVDKKIYWVESEGGKIRQGSLDGTQTAVTLFTKADGVLKVPFRIAIDPGRGKLYINDNVSIGRHRIYLGDIDGGGSLTSLIEEGVPNNGGVLDMEVDLSRGFLYWMNSIDDGAIRRMKLDGSGAETVYSNIHMGNYMDIDLR